MDGINQPIARRRERILIASAGLAGVMLFTLAPIPRAGAASNMPWKGELAAALFLVIALLITKRSRVADIPGVRTLFLLLITFTLFSALSGMWASSVGWVVHHTLVWGCYIGFLLLFLQWLQDGTPRILLITFGVVAVALAGMMILDLTTGPDFEAHAGGIFRIRYGKFAELLVTISPVLATVPLYTRNRVLHLVAVIIWLCAWIGVMLSLSRGAFLAGAAAHILVFAGCLLFSARRKHSAVLATVWLVITIAVQLGLPVITTTPTTTDYLTGTMDKTRVNVVFRTFSWSIGKEMALDHWLLGVGSDNFGIEVNETRKAMAQRHPLGDGLEPFEDFLIERAHNEPMQVVAELGVIGIVLLLTAVAWLIFWISRVLFRRRFRMSPVFWGALAGVAGFAASSMVSSFSFRAIQNGVAFFAVLAIMMNELRKLSPAAPSMQRRGNGRVWRRIAIAFGSLMIIFAGTKTIAEYTLYTAERTADESQARALYERALWLDRDNAQGWFAYASGISKSDPATATQHVYTAIRRGLGATTVYSRLADYHQEANDNEGMKRAFEEGLSYFPRSVFLRVRYAVALERLGEMDKAREQMSIAAFIDARQAKGWRAMLTDGSVAAFYLSKDDPASAAAPSELQPPNAVLQYLDKTN